MSFNPSFTAEQLYATPTILRVTDTGNNIEDNIITEDELYNITDENYIELVTETDDTFINDIKVYLRKDDGKYLVPSDVETDFVEIPIGQNYVDIDVLDKDYSLEIKVVEALIGIQLISEINKRMLLTQKGNPIIANIDIDGMLVASEQDFLLLTENNNSIILN